MGCKGLHCDGCSHGGPGFAAGFGALVVLGGVLVYAGHRHAIDHAAGVAAEYALIFVLTVVGIAAAAALTVAGVRLQRAVAHYRGERQMLAPPRVRVLPTAEPGAGQSPAIEARPRLAWPLAGWAPGTRPQIGRGRDDRRR